MRNQKFNARDINWPSSAKPFKASANTNYQQALNKHAFNHFKHLRKAFVARKNEYGQKSRNAQKEADAHAHQTGGQAHIFYFGIFLRSCALRWMGWRHKILLNLWLVGLKGLLVFIKSYCPKKQNLYITAPIKRLSQCMASR